LGFHWYVSHELPVSLQLMQTYQSRRGISSDNVQDIKKCSAAFASGAAVP
jgi:hypothetical protein